MTRKDLWTPIGTPGVSRNILQKAELSTLKQVEAESYCDFGKSINVASFVFSD